MKRVLLTCLALSSLTTAPLAFGQTFEHESFNPDELIVLTGSRRAGIGMSRAALTAAMQGEPDEKLSADVWVYWNFKPSRRGDDTETGDALVIVFQADKVSRLRVAAAQPVRQAIAALERTRMSRPAVAKRE
jgi:hypothetical protein